MKEKILNNVLFFSGSGNPRLGAESLIEISEFIGAECRLQHINIAQFGDGESDTRIPRFQNVKDKTIVFFQSMNTPESVEETMELLWALRRQYQASYLIAVIFFVYGRRQDHPEKAHEITRLEMIIDRLAHVGMNELLTVTPHSDKMKEYCIKYGVKFNAIDPTGLFADTIKTYVPSWSTDPICVYAPDEGSVPRAIALAKLLNCLVLFNIKRRGHDDETGMVQLTPQMIAEKIQTFVDKYEFINIDYAVPKTISGKIIVMTEDEISSGGTAMSTGNYLKDSGANRIYFLASHAVLVPGWRNKLFDISNNNPFEEIIITDSIYRSYAKRTGGEIHDISLKRLIATAIYQSLSEHLK